MKLNTNGHDAQDERRIAKEIRSTLPKGDCHLNYSHGGVRRIYDARTKNGVLTLRVHTWDEKKRCADVMWYAPPDGTWVTLMTATPEERIIRL
jgi:hypothetical protein